MEKNPEFSGTAGSVADYTLWQYGICLGEEAKRKSAIARQLHMAEGPCRLPKNSIAPATDQGLR